ncbi:unnamed protein product [Euphydryas editha]|uniref:Uncharacterized protein n=1 Tax=Euphydryas editha TaxID=104508 RepID=A0AAU9VCT5_EUPED|nr:unnamed protein product [Euphydryas editha]
MPVIFFNKVLSKSTAVPLFQSPTLGDWSVIVSAPKPRGSEPRLSLPLHGSYPLHGDVWSANMGQTSVTPKQTGSRKAPKNDGNQGSAWVPHHLKVLASSVPWDLDTQSLADVYWQCASVRAEGSNPPPKVVRQWRDSAKERAIELWAERLEEPQVSVRLLTSIRPVLKEWINRKSGALSFHLTQLMTRHGCFGWYLCEIAQREDTTDAAIATWTGIRPNIPSRPVPLEQDNVWP